MQRDNPHHRNITIRNGRIDVHGAGSVGIDFHGGSSFCLNLDTSLRAKGPRGFCPFEDEKDNKYRYFHEGKGPRQADTRYRIENMRIHAGGRAVSLGGANNVLRGNTLEVDGHTAVVMYGPGAIIENNTFIVHLDPAIPTPTLPAIIKLRDADGAVIRNNRFIVNASFPWGRQAEAAINLLESRDVVIENNAAENVKLLVRKDEPSTTLERGNIVR